MSEQLSLLLPPPRKELLKTTFVVEVIDICCEENHIRHIGKNFRVAQRVGRIRCMLLLNMGHICKYIIHVCRGGKEVAIVSEDFSNGMGKVTGTYNEAMFDLYEDEGDRY